MRIINLLNNTAEALEVLSGQNYIHLTTIKFFSFQDLRLIRS